MIPILIHSDLEDSLENVIADKSLSYLFYELSVGEVDISLLRSRPNLANFLNMLDTIAKTDDKNALVGSHKYVYDSINTNVKD